LHFLVTNDDGYDAEGLAVLARLARTLGTADIVAPLVPQSQTSHAVTLWEPLEVRPIERHALGPILAVAGRPADCTRLAAAGLAGDRKPDWVLSGINHGANLGVDVFYSGTVAAAREAAILGIPAISISQFVRRPEPTDWSGTAVMAERALREIFCRDCPAGNFWNVNLPALDGGFEEASIIEAPVAMDPLPMAYDSVPPPAEADPGSAGARHYVYAGRYPERTREPGSDVDVTFAGNISISRLGLRT